LQEPIMAATPTPPQKAERAQAAVIRRVEGAHETKAQRLVRKQLPAWVVSGAVHVMLVAAMIGADMVMAKPAAPPPSLTELTVVPPAEEKEVDVNLTNPDIGLDPELIPVTDSEKLDDVNVDTAVQPTETPGIEQSDKTAKVDFAPLAGVGMGDTAGLAGDTGAFMAGAGAGGEGTMASDAMNGRGSATRSKLVARGGGNDRSEAAVALGLVWLVKQQKPNGMWVFDGDNKADTVTATAMGLLPFLAAGQTHTSRKADNKYKANVDAAIKYILASQKPDGTFRTMTNMYSQAIATVAICELLGMSGDKALVPYAQRAVKYIVDGQGADGSWGYKAGTTGDTSIVGWQIQALQSARLCKDLVVDKRAYERTRKFLDKVAAGPNKSTYGYSSPGKSLTLTPVGLLCRYYADGWGPTNPGMASGVSFLLKSRTPSKAANFDIYYYYYATQIMHFFEGKEWYEVWNPAMRDLLIDRQVARSQKEAGSWEADAHLMGTHTGRLGTTSLALLTLEVYYRHLPLYKRDTGGLKELERIK
jgi:hypothetical protein